MGDSISSEQLKLLLQRLHPWLTGTFLRLNLLPRRQKRASKKKLRGQLDALLQVSLAWATVSDPEQQSRLALDEIVRVLHAERAFLFLNGSSGHGPILCAGRDNKGNTITDSYSYSDGVVREVWNHRRPLVIRSGAYYAPVDRLLAQAGLRSVMAVPLQLGDRMLGVVYVDSHLSHVAFTYDDVKILLAIASHIAIALEVTQTAQLEMRIQAERQRRHMAETLREVSSAMNMSLDLPEVLDRVLVGLSALVPYDSAAVCLLEGDQLAYLAARGHPNIEAVRNLRIPLDHLPLNNEVIQSARPLILTDARYETSFRQQAGSEQVRSWIGVPLIVRDQSIGMLTVDSYQIGQYGETEAQLAFAFASQAVIAIENARLFGEVTRLATIDELTGIANRRHFFKQAEAEFQRIKRYRHPLAAIMLDVDHFKWINDTYGHSIGDEVLRLVAYRCRKNLREVDILGRYGGEEFAILLPETDALAALMIAERLGREIASNPLPTSRGDLIVTASLGVAGLLKSTPNIHALLAEADNALYAAKAAGRNCVVGA